MREGWKYCKLGDVCVIERGGSPRPIDNYITDSADGLNWIKIGDATDGSKYITHTKEKIRKEGLKKTRFVHKGDFILSNSMSFGKPYILDIDGCIHDGWLVIHDEANAFNKSFLYYILSSPTMYREFKRLAVGGVVNNLNSQIVRDVVVAIPPLPEQERIVAELDLLTCIIDKQKAQLKELDVLAQSIFYDMFGDPVENEKGWEMYEIASVCDDLFAGGDKPKDFSEEKDDDYKYPIIGNGDGERGILGYSKSYRVGKAAVTIGARGASIGNCRICEPHFTPVVRLITLVPNKRVNLGYLYAISRKLSFNVNGAGQAQLTTPNVANKLIPVPPRELQDSFAQKIQSMESQKASINRSIAETQKLFDYTMDKYFG